MSEDDSTRDGSTRAGADAGDFDEPALSAADEAHVHDLLAALPDPEVPSDVRDRIAAALATPANATVLPARRRAEPSRPSSSWRHPRLLQAAAVLVIFALVGAAGWGLVVARNDSGPGATVAGGGSGATASGVITASGTAYTAANLGPAVRALLTGETPAAGGLTASRSGSTSADSADSAKAAAPPGAMRALVALMHDPATRQHCLDQLSGVPGTQALAIDLGVFNSKPAAVIVLPSDLVQTSLDVWVVGATCSDADNPFPYQYQQVPRP